MTRKSAIFGNKELKLLEARINGSRDDPTGHFSRLVRPKVEEMLQDWLPRRKELERAVKRPQDKA